MSHGLQLQSLLRNPDAAASGCLSCKGLCAGFKVPKEFKMANVVGEKETEADKKAAAEPGGGGLSAAPNRPLRS